MLPSYERDDIIHIMKMNRFVLTEADSAQLLFGGRINKQDFKVRILMIEHQPQTMIEKNGKRIFNKIIDSVDDLKIFLEEQFYKYLNDNIG